jgi:hypothetical protein
MAEWWEAAPKASTIDIASDAEGASPAVADLARSVYHQESTGGKNTKTSNAGAVGGMQILPDTFNEVADKGWDINNPEHNARAGVRYLKKLNDLAGGDPKLTAVGYYGGPGAIEKAKKGIAVSDPRNPEAPNTLQYGDQVAGRVQGGSNWWEAAPIEGQNPAAPTVSPTKAPSAAKKPVAPTDSAAPKADEPHSWLREVDDTVRHIADTATFGLADKFAAKMDELTGRTKGTTYDQNLANERKKDEDASTGAKVVGGLAGAAVPGLGILKAVQAPATASRVVRGLYGAGVGAAEGAASGLGHNDSDNLVDKVKSAGVGAGVGAALGGPLAAVMPATMSQKVASYVKQHGEEGARRVAEATQDLTGLASREAQGGKAIGAKQANAIGNGYVAQAMDHIADPEIRTALQRGQALSDAQLAKLPPDIAAIINKQTTVAAQTAAKPASDGILAKAARVAARNLIPIEALRNLAVNAAGGRETREAVIQKLIKQGPVADKVLEQYGPSKGAQALKVLQAKSAATQAQNASRAGFGTEAGQVLAKDAENAQVKAAADAVKAKTAADAQATAADLAAKAQASRNAMSKATRMPLGGGFQETLQGGRSGLDLTSKDSLAGLRALSNHPVLGPAATELRRTGKIADENSFYAVQNGLRGLKEQGYIGKQMQGPQGALSSATEAVRNPIAYKEAVRQAGSALDRAVSKAPTDELAGFASQVANLRTTAAKEALVQSRLQSATPTEAKFIKELVHPLTKYGPKK